MTISADKTSAVFKEDNITYTLTRTGSTTAALPVTVRLMQTEDFLAATELTNKTVTINAGQSTATFTVAASSFQHFAAGTKVEGGTLEAAVQDGANYDLGMTSSVEVNFFIGVMIRFEMERYSVGEAAGSVKVTVFARSGPHAPQPTSGVPYDIRPGGGSATNSSDFFFVNLHPEFLSSNFEEESDGVWQAEHIYDVTITDDEVNEVDETFDVQIARSDSQTYSLVDAEGKSCGSVCTATVTIIDDDTAQVMGVGVAPGNAQLVVTWTAVDTATGYTVQWTSGGQGYNTGDRQAPVTPGSTTSHTIEGLANGTAYTVRVIATRTGTTDGPPSEEMTGTPRVPPPPPPPVTDLAQVMGVGVAPGNAQLVVTWTAVDTATGYTVQWMSGGEDYNTGDRQAPVTSGSTTRYTIPSLTNGTAYTMRVIATRTGVTDGPPSEEMTGTPRVPPPPPPPVTDLAQVMGVGVAPGNAQLVVTWTAVDTATGYTVQWMSGGEDYNTGDRQAPVTSGSTTRYTIPSLTNGTAYTVRVIATRTGATDGPPSEEMTGTPAVPTREPFEVDIVGVPEVAVAGESYELTAQSDEDSLVYAWRVDGGAIEPDDVQMVVWTAPETAGVAWIHVDVTREDDVTAGHSAYVRVEVPEPEPEPEPEPVPALPLLGQLLLALGLAGAGAMRLVRAARRP